MYKLCCIILISVISVLPSFAQSRLFKSGNVQKDIYTEIPFEIFHGHIIVTAKVNGESRRFLFDTGACNMLSERFLSKTGKQKKLKVSDSQSQSKKMVIGLVDSIELGGVSFYDYAAVASNIGASFPFSCYEIEGFIGSNMLRGLIVKIDLGAKKIIISDDLSKISPTSEPTKMKLWKDQIIPYIPITFGSSKENHFVMFDSGYNGFLAFSKKDLEKINSKEDAFQRIVAITGRGSLGIHGAVDSDQYFATLKNANIVGATLQNINTSSSRGETKIGSTLLQFGSVILDFKNSQFYFDAKSAIQDLSASVAAYSVSASQDRYVVGYVLREDLKGSMKSGDEIISVDGKDLRGMSPCEMFAVSPHAKECLQVLSDGKVIDIIL